MVRKVTFQRSFELTTSGSTTAYTTVLDLEDILQDATILPTKVTNDYEGTFRDMNEGALILDITTLVYNEGALSFAGATRSALVLGVEVDGYGAVSRHVAVTDMPCSPSWTIAWHFWDGVSVRTLMSTASTVPVDARFIQMSIAATGGDQRFFTVLEGTLFDINA